MKPLSQLIREAQARIALDGKCPVCERDCYDLRCPDSHYWILGVHNPGRRVVVGLFPRSDHPYHPIIRAALV